MNDVCQEHSIYSMHERHCELLGLKVATGPIPNIANNEQSHASPLCFHDRCLSSTRINMYRQSNQLFQKPHRTSYKPPHAAAWRVPIVSPTQAAWSALYCPLTAYQHLPNPNHGPRRSPLDAGHRLPLDKEQVRHVRCFRGPRASIVARHSSNSGVLGPL